MTTYIGRVLRHQLTDAWHQEAMEFLDAVPGGLAGKRVLDFGCGPGKMAYFVWLFGARQVDGVDKQEMLSVAKRHYPRGPEFLTYPSGQYDVILLSHVLGHVDDARRTLDELIDRHLAPNGVVAVLNPNVWNTRARALSNRLRGYKHDPTLKHHFSKLWLDKVLRGDGLECAHWYRTGVPWTQMPSVFSKPLFAAFYKDHRYVS